MLNMSWDNVESKLCGATATYSFLNGIIDQIFKETWSLVSLVVWICMIYKFKFVHGHAITIFLDEGLRYVGV